MQAQHVQSLRTSNQKATCLCYAQSAAGQTWLTRYWCTCYQVSTLTGSYRVLYISDPRNRHKVNKRMSGCCCRFGGGDEGQRAGPNAADSHYCGSGPSEPQQPDCGHSLQRPAEGPHCPPRPVSLPSVPSPPVCYIPHHALKKAL